METRTKSQEALRLILELVKAGRIDADEAEKLMTALLREEPQESSPRPSEPFQDVLRSLRAEAAEAAQWGETLARKISQQAQEAVSEAMSHLGEHSAWGEWMRAADGETFTREAEWTEPVEGLAQLQISNVSGRLSLRGGEGPTIRIRATTQVRATTKEAAEERLAAIATRVHRVEDRLEITVSPAEYQRRSRGKVDLDIEVPADLTIRAHLANGKIVGEEVHGDLTLESLNGGIEIRTSQGSLRLKTTNGSISITEHQGPVEMETLNGKLLAQKVEGPVRFRNLNGMVYIQDVVGTLDGEALNGALHLERIRGSIRARNGNGHLYVMEPEGNACDAQTKLGRIQVERPHVQQLNLHTNDGSIVVELDEPFEESLHATTHMGSIRVRMPLESNCRLLAESTVHGRIRSSTPFHEWPLRERSTSRRRVEGILGEGRGEIVLKTEMGSIRLDPVA